MSVNTSTTRAVLELRMLSKRYGKRYVLRAVSLDVQAGKVHALVGVNGAGKTTLLRLATGLAYPSSGTVRLLGYDPSKNPYVKRALGAVIEAPAAFYPYLSGRDNLLWQGRLLALGKSARERIDTLLTRLELASAADQTVGGYSLGMKQRLGLAAALLGEPKLLILDEPASSIDPLSVQTIYRVLRDAARQGCAVLLSTHHLEDVSHYCDEVSVLDAGALATHITLDGLRDCYFVQVSHANKAQDTLQEAGFTVREVQGNRLLVEVPQKQQLGRVAYVLARARIALFDLRPYRLDLAALLDGYRQTRPQPEVNTPEVNTPEVNAPEDAA
jgi:ABC-2 type transport system ATP-binding protein